MADEKPVVRKARGDGHPGLTRAELDAMTFEEPFTPVKVWRRELVGTAKDAEGCLSLIGKEWDNAPFTGSGARMTFEFELDEHRFVVQVSPLPSGDGQS